ncbi:hypothetical protein [Streptomyces virginiae]
MEISHEPGTIPLDLDDPAVQPGLRHAFGLAVVAALRTAGFVVEPRDDDVLVVDPGHPGEAWDGCGRRPTTAAAFPPSHEGHGDVWCGDGGTWTERAQGVSAAA